MASFGYPNKSKTLEFAQHFWVQSSFWAKINFIQQLDEEDYIKSMYSTYITYIFLTTIGPHVYDSWNIIKQKNLKI